LKLEISKLPAISTSTPPRLPTRYAALPFFEDNTLITNTWSFCRVGPSFNAGVGFQHIDCRYRKATDVTLWW